MKFYVCVDESGRERAFELPPIRWYNFWKAQFLGESTLKNGSIKTFTGENMTWDDDPVLVVVEDK